MKPDQLYRLHTGTPARVLIFDLETTNLSADFGWIICWGWKWLGEKNAHVKSVLDFKHGAYVTDKHLLTQIYGEVKQADLVVGWYSSRFDWPYLQSRLLLAQGRILPPIPHVDGWWTARKKLKLHSNRLDSVQKFLQLPTPKTAILPTHWTLAQQGHHQSIEYIKQHCYYDVECLEQAYLVLRPLVQGHPNVSLSKLTCDHCPVCGSPRVSHVKDKFNRVTQSPLYRCVDCKAWSQGKPERIMGELRLR
jgi:uncharacterized protein YprB with RNaseH-like and TPR domain